MRLRTGNTPCPRELECERNHDFCEAQGTLRGFTKHLPLRLASLQGSGGAPHADHGLLTRPFPLQLHSLPPSFGLERAAKSERDPQTMFTEYCTCGDIIGELSCLLKREIEYTATCETILQVSPRVLSTLWVIRSLLLGEEGMPVRLPPSCSGIFFSPPAGDWGGARRVCRRGCGSCRDVFLTSLSPRSLKRQCLTFGVPEMRKLPG